MKRTLNEDAIDDVEVQPKKRVLSKRLKKKTEKCKGKTDLQAALPSVTSFAKISQQNLYTFMNTKKLLSLLESIGDSNKLVLCVPDGLKENRFFLVNNIMNAKRNILGLKEVYKDDSGPWNYNQSHTVTRYFFKDAQKLVELKDGLYCTETRKNKKRVLIPLDPQPNPESVISIHSHYVRHKDSDSYRRKVTSFGNLPQEIPLVAIYEYCGSAPLCLKEKLGDCDMYCSGSQENIFEEGADCLSLVISEHPSSSSRNPLEETSCSILEDSVLLNEDPLSSSQSNVLSAVISPIEGGLDGDCLDLDRPATFISLEAVMDKLSKKLLPSEVLAHVPRGLKENQLFIVDNSENVRRHRLGRKSTFWDDSGPWVSQITTTSTYLHESGKTLKKIVNHNGEYCTEHKLESERIFVPLSPQPDPSTIIILHRNSAKHKDSKRYQRRVTWFEDQDEIHTPAACYEYLGSPPHSVVMSLADKNCENYEAKQANSHNWTRYPNGGFELSHPDGRFLDLYDIINVLKMNDIADEPLESVPEGKKENQFFIVCNKSNIERQRMGKSNIFWDDCGAWDSKSTKVITERFLCGLNKKLTKVVNLQGELCVERSKDGNRVYLPLSPQPDPKTVLVLHRNYSKHSMSSSYRRKVTWLEGNGKDFPKIACYEYLGKFPGHYPHGSCTKNYRNYIRAKESTLTEKSEGDLCHTYQNEEDEEALDSIDSFKFIENICFPENVKNICSKFSNIENTTPKLTSGIACDMVQLHPFVQVVHQCKGKETSFILYIKEQILDIKRFCCYLGHNETTVLCFSKTKTFCGLTLTYSVYRNLSLSRNKQNPLFAGPMYLHEEADYYSYLTFFTHLAAELGKSHSQLIIISEGKDMQRAFALAFPNGFDLSSIQHLQKEFLNHLKEQGGIHASQKNVLKTLIFGDDGIINSKDTNMFTHLLEKVQKLCEEMAPNIGTFFNTTMVPELRKNFLSLQKLKIPSSGLKWTSLLFSSFKHAVKLYDIVSAQSELHKLIQDLYKPVVLHYKETEQCLIGLGKFTLAPEFNDFMVFKDHWRRIGESERNRLLYDFLGKVKTRECK